MKEKILKLMQSSIEEDLLLALELLKGKSCKDIQELFNVRVQQSITRTKCYLAKRVRISNDCVLYVFSDIFISGYPENFNLDLTI